MRKTGTPAVDLNKSDREEELPSPSSVTRYDDVSSTSQERLLQSENVINRNGRGQPLKIVTWNVRTLYQAGKLDNCLQEMSRLNIDILGVAETRWTDAGAVDKENYVMYFSGGNKHVNGVGIIIRKNLSRSVQGYIAKSERIIMLKMEGKPFDVVIIQAYTPIQEMCSSVWVTLMPK